MRCQPRGILIWRCTPSTVFQVTTSSTSSRRTP